MKQLFKAINLIQGAKNRKDLKGAIKQAAIAAIEKPEIALVLLNCINGKLKRLEAQNERESI